MLIGVDCSHLTEEGRTGTENYLYSVLKNLAVTDAENEYLLYFRVEPSKLFWDDICGQKRKWRYKVIDSKVSWVQVGLARATFLDKPDRLLCTWHTLPILHRRQTKIISVIHDFSCSVMRSYPLYASLLLSYRLIGVSEYTYKGILTRVPWRRESVYKQHEGVDLSKYKKTDAEGINATKKKYLLDRPYFLSVGTLNKRKNLENMITAFSLLLEESQNRDIDYVIVGKCIKGYESIYDFVKKVRFGGRIKFLGRLNDDDVVNLYSGALSLLYISKDEGFGLPVLEAMACGCNVVTSSIAPMKEVGGNTVIFADPNNVESIKKALYYVINPKNKMSLTDKKLAGLARAKTFSWKNCANFLKNIY
ncbi:MAG: glycosyltransferase family 1 protein [Patescibacteria group bacterium]